MSASTKLSTAVKALCFMAKDPLKANTSSDIASQIGVNASKLRKLLSMLVKSSIVQSAQGSRGGFVLNKPAEDIHLQEIYCAIEDRKAFHLDVRELTNNDLADAGKLNNYFNNLFSEIQIEIEDKMRHITLDKVMDNALNN